MAIVGSFSLAIVFGLMCYQLLRHVLFTRGITTSNTASSATSFPFISSLRGMSTQSTPFNMSSVFQYLPGGIIPMSVQARMRGYTDISDETPVACSQDTEGSGSILDKSQNGENGDNGDFIHQNDHIIELRKIRKINSRNELI